MRQLMAVVAVALVASAVAGATPDQLFAAGKQAMAQRDFDKAADLLSQAVKAKPDNAEYHYWLGQAYGSQTAKASIFGKASLAGKTREEFERASQLDPNFLDARFGLIEFYLQAPGFMGGGEEKAVAQAQEIRKRDALAGHRAFGRIYSFQKKPDLAKKEYLDAIREQPNSPKAHIALGVFYLTEKTYPQAVAAFEDALKLDNNYMPSWFWVGRSIAAAETNYARGEEALKKYLAYTPKSDEPPHARTWYWLGMIYEKTGRKADAKQSYITSLKLAPESKEVTEALKRVS